MTEKAPVKKGKIDYKEVLDEPDFRVYAALRDLRKKLADQEGVPVYAVFTNEQLAEMARRRTGSDAQLSEIPGVGESRVKKYGELFIDLIKAEAEKLFKSDDGETS